MKDKFINPYTDFGFKKLFGEEGSRDLLQDFLNEVLAGERRIVHLTLKPTEFLGSNNADRKAIFDIFCTSEKGDSFIVEIQKAKINWFKDRTVLYSTFPIRNQAEKGEWDYQLKPVYCVAILDFEFDKTNSAQKAKDHPTHTHSTQASGFKHEQAQQEANSENYLSHVQLRDQYCNIFYDKLTYIFIEMPRFNKKEHELTTHFEKWLYFLKHLPDFNEIPAILNEPIFRKGFQKAEILNYTKAELELYEESLKVYRDLKGVIDTSYMEGESKGFAEGKIEGKMEGKIEGKIEGKKEGIMEAKRDTARSMKKEGLPTDIICRITGISVEEINQLE